MTHVRALLAFVALALVPLSTGCGAPGAAGLPGEGEVGGLYTLTDDKSDRPGICAILCIAPPDGCEYRGGIYTGPCNRVTCGRIVCQKDGCPIIDCAAPPSGCHYEGMITSPCNKQTCGTLVCDGAPL